MKHSKICRSAFARMLYALLTAVLTILLLSGCSPSTKPDKGDLSGSVILFNDTEDPALDTDDHSGITVAIYKAITLNPIITALNVSHPNLGERITQDTEFDHRLHDPYKMTLTNASGSFSLSGLPTGKYNLVVLKQGWGVRYLCDIQIQEGANPLQDYLTGTAETALRLFPVVQFSGYVNQDVEFKSHHSYLITDNTYFSYAVTFSPSAYIWINPQKSLFLYGYVTSPDVNARHARITSADKMYSSVKVLPADIQNCYEVQITNLVTLDQNILQKLNFSFFDNGLKVKHNDLTVRNMHFKYSKVGILFEQISNIAMLNSVIQNCVDPEMGGVTLYDCDYTNLSKLIIINSRVGIRQHSCENAVITNSYFSDNTHKDIYNLYDNYSQVTYCTFRNSDIAIDTSGKSITTVSYCDFNARIGLYNYAQNNWTWSRFTVNNSNLDCSLHGIKTFSVCYTEYHFDATNNYWGTTSLTTISGPLIYDYHDVDSSHPDYWRLLGFIDYLPIKYSRVPTAGITNN